MWNDIVFTVGSLLLSVALIPSIISAYKPDARTSFLTGSVLAVFSVNYLTLGLYFSTVSTVLSAVLWYVLMVQELKIRRREDPSNS